MYNCDVHILTLPHDNQTWLAECIDSLKDEPINYHVLNGYDGHIGKGRYEGFMKGQADYISFVDSDDYIIPGIFKQCIDILDNDPSISVVCSKEQVLKEDGTIHTPQDFRDVTTCRSISRATHHVVVMRRKDVEDYLPMMNDWVTGSEIALWATLCNAGKRFYYLNEIGYVWRVHDGCSHKHLKPEKTVSDYILNLIRT